MSFVFALNFSPLMSSGQKTRDKLSIIAFPSIVFISTFTADWYAIASENNSIQFSDDNFFFNIHGISTHCIYRRLTGLTCNARTLQSNISFSSIPSSCSSWCTGHSWLSYCLCKIFSVLKVNNWRWRSFSPDNTASVDALLQFSGKRFGQELLSILFLFLF